MSILPPRVQPPSPAGPFWLCTLPPIYKHNQSRRLTHRVKHRNSLKQTNRFMCDEIKWNKTRKKKVSAFILHKALPRPSAV